MERGKTAVVDASVVVKWFNAEEHSDLADQLKSKHIKGDITLVAPVLMLFEVANALRYSPDFSVNDVKDAARDLLDLQITLHYPEKEWMEGAVETAYNHGITIYDACYIALAKSLKTCLYTSDEKLLERVNDPTLKHISELRK